MRCESESLGWLQMLLVMISGWEIEGDVRSVGMEKGGGRGDMCIRSDNTELQPHALSTSCVYVPMMKCPRSLSE